MMSSRHVLRKECPPPRSSLVRRAEPLAAFAKAFFWEHSWHSPRGPAGGEECPRGIPLRPCQHPGWGHNLSLPMQGGHFSSIVLRLCCCRRRAPPSQNTLKQPRGTRHLSRIHLPSNRCITTKQDLFRYNLSRLDKASKLAETYIKGFSGIGAREAITFPGSETRERGSRPCCTAQEG